MSDNGANQSPHGHLQSNLRGIVWALLATAMFATAAAMAKVAVKDYHVLQILFFRQIVVFLSSLPSIANTFPASLKTQYPTLHTYRLLGSFVALSGSIWAVAVLPLTTAITLGFAQVFFIALLAMYFLNEKVGLHRIGAVVAGFVGVMVVMRPGTDGLLNVQSVIPVVAAAGAAVAITSVRKLSQTGNGTTVLLPAPFILYILTVYLL